MKFLMSICFFLVLNFATFAAQFSITTDSVGPFQVGDYAQIQLLTDVPTKNDVVTFSFSGMTYGVDYLVNLGVPEKDKLVLSIDDVKREDLIIYFLNNANTKATTASLNVKLTKVPEEHLIVKNQNHVALKVIYAENYGSIENACCLQDAVYHWDKAKGVLTSSDVRAGNYDALNSLFTPATIDTAPLGWKSVLVAPGGHTLRIYSGAEIGPQTYQRIYADEVDSDNTMFNKRPKVKILGYDSYSKKYNRVKKANARVMFDKNHPQSVQVVYRSPIKLYHAANLKRARKEGFMFPEYSMDSRIWRSSVGGEISVTTQTVKDLSVGAVVFAAPQLEPHYFSNLFTAIPILIEGKYLGSKPKVYLEYLNTRGEVKTKNLKILRTVLNRTTGEVEKIVLKQIKSTSDMMLNEPMYLLVDNGIGFNRVTNAEDFHLKINGEDLFVPLNFTSGAFYDAVTLNTEVGNKIEWLNPFNNGDLTLNEQSFKDTPLAFEIRTIHKDNALRVNVKLGLEEKHFYIRTQNSALPEFITKGVSMTDGDFYMSFVNARAIMKVDNHGNIMYYRCEDNTMNRDGTGLWDFKKHVIDAKTYYSYHSSWQNYDGLQFSGYAPGERVVMDANYAVIDRVTTLASEHVDAGHPLDGHEFVMLGEKHYIVDCYLHKVVHNVPEYNQYTGVKMNPNPNGVGVVAPYIQEQRNGEVVFDWMSTNYPEFYSMTIIAASLKANDFANAQTDTPDYMHYNSLDIDDDNNFIVSFRHCSTIAKINRTTREVMWRLSDGLGDEYNASDFTLSDTEHVSCQHFARYHGNGYITAFDNSNSLTIGNKMKTRFVRYKINEASMSLESFESWVVRGHFSFACGSFQIMDETIGIGVASWGSNTTGNELISEFILDPEDSKVYFEIKIVDDSIFPYRCPKY